MKIGVISDTHDHMDNVKKFVKIFIDRKVNAVFHCGDLVAPFMWTPFEPIKKANIPFYFVYGNNDGERAGIKKIFGNVCEIKGDFFETTLNNKKILMFHDLSPEMVDALAKSGSYHVILKGHTHQKEVKKIGNTLLVNPGEGCGYLTGKASVAIVDIDELKAEFIELN
jgi:uncharacterized protein